MDRNEKILADCESKKFYVDGGIKAIEIHDLEQILNAQPESENYSIPSNWLDPLLSGDNAVLGNPPYGCDDIERLLNVLRKRTAHTDNEIAKRKIEEFLNSGGISSGYINTLSGFQEWLDKEDK